MRSRNWVWLVMAALTVALTGCTTYATPDTSSVGLAYTGGSWDSKAFEKCIPAGGNEAIDNGGDTAYYPQGTRTWAFGNGPGMDSGPILVSTKNQELIQGGIITFTLDTTCTEWTDAAGTVWPGGPLQKFHETIGRSNAAEFTEDSTQVPQGWRDVLGKFLGGPANRVMDTTAGNYTWQQMYSDPAIVQTFTDQVVKDLPDKIKDATGGDTFFKIISIQVDKPQLPDELMNQMRIKEAEILAQDTATQKRLFQESWPGGIAGYQAFQRQEAETKCIAEGRCTLIPAGVGVAVPAS
jgi:hypothetical protein